MSRKAPKARASNGGAVRVRILEVRDEGTPIGEKLRRVLERTPDSVSSDRSSRVHWLLGYLLGDVLSDEDWARLNAWIGGGSA